MRIAALVTLICLCTGALAGGAGYRWYSHKTEPPFDKNAAYDLRRSLFTLSKRPAAVVMAGDSIAEGADWAEITGCPFVANRGISGDTSEGLLTRVATDVLALKPKAVIVLIGTNDIGKGADPMAVARNIRMIADRITAENADVYIERIFPTRSADGLLNEKIRAVNAILETSLTGNMKARLIDTPALHDADGALRADLSINRRHLNARGYEAWAAALAPLMARYCPQPRN